ncbi:MAG: hypothetical protein ACQCN5_02875 [Candidatus Bathyarchaeia archaeon]|jgi:hypothetical protein
MKKQFNWQIALALILVTLSGSFYFLHYLIFGDLHHIFIYLIGDIAFLFIDVLIVTLVLHRLLVYREKQSVMKKINIVIDTFFSEVGTDLLKICLKFDTNTDDFKKKLLVTKEWSNKDFIKTKQNIAQHSGIMDSKRHDLTQVKIFLINKRQFILNLLDNPNLVEHESFTNLLLAILHLTDELVNRPNLTTLPQSDYDHLSEDMKRAYIQLILQWLDYVKHLKIDYPYLFSLALRINPFDENALVEVREIQSPQLPHRSIDLRSM